MLRIAVFLLITSAVLAQPAPRLIERGGPGDVRLAGRTVAELAAMSDWRGCYLYNTDTKMNTRNYRKADRLALNLARKLLPRATEEKTAMIAIDQRRCAFSSRSSDDLLAINIREGASGVLHINRIEVRTKDRESRKQWLDRLAAVHVENAEDRQQMADTAFANYENKVNQRAVSLVRDAAYRYDLWTTHRRDGKAFVWEVGICEIFGGRPAGEGTEFTIGNVNPD